jgi:hypothetical protein
MIRCLTLHAAYGCRHSGACCTAGWPIPIEADRLEALDRALADGRLHAARAAPAAWVRPPDGPAGTPALLHADASGCVFHDTARRRCRLQHALGHGALPLACRQFPRVSIVDPRGTSVTLSHFCPTAADLLEIDQPVAITTTAAGFPAGTELVGLDVRAALPPLIRPDMLMDWASWWTWEQHAVDVLGRPGQTADAGLAALAQAVARVRTWSPADGPLDARVEEAFGGTPPANAPPSFASGPLVDSVLSAIPAELRPRHLEPSLRPAEGVLCRFLAAHAFANWTGHLGEGLHVWLASIAAAAALIDHGLSVRQADLILRHLADPYVLAAALGRVAG